MIFVTSQRNSWLTLVVFVLVVRVASSVALFHGLQDDPDAYRSLAENWARHGTFGLASAEGIVSPTAYRPPLYPWLLSWFVDGEHQLRSPMVVVLHVILGSLTCLIAADIYRRLRPNDPCWLMAGLFIAVDPILLRQASLVMTETLATFLGIVVWWMWLASPSHPNTQHVGDRRSAEKPQVRYSLTRAVVIALMLALNIYCRPTGLVWVGGLLLGSLVVDRSVALIVRARWLMAIAAVVLIALTPWAIRNQRVFGQKVWLTTHGGYTLLLANNPLIFEHLKSSRGDRNWDASLFHQRWQERRGDEVKTNEYWTNPSRPRVASTLPTSQPMGEWRSDRLANEAAIQTIREHPSEFVWSSLVRIAWLWALWPADGNGSTGIRIVVGLWYGLIFLLAGFGVTATVRNRNLSIDLMSWLPGLMLVLSITMVHAIYWSNMRMRAPCMPTVYIFATIGISSWIMRTIKLAEVDENSKPSMDGLYVVLQEGHSYGT